MTGPHVEIIGVIEHQEPLAGAFFAQMSFDKSLYICLNILAIGYAELVGDIQVCLMQTFYISRRDPDDRAVAILISDLVGKLER